MEEAGVGVRGRECKRVRVDRDSFYMFISNVVSSAEVLKKLFNFYASYNYFYLTRLVWKSFGLGLMAD